MVSQQDNKPQPSYISVDPETAKRWLAGNKVNRNLRAPKVTQYARDMADGRWQLNSDAIAFSPDGHLLNGQHRLNAVIESGVAVVFLIVRNMPPEAMTTMDSGVARGAADALKLAGEQNVSQLAACAKLCLLIKEGRIYRDNKHHAVSHGEIMDLLETEPGIRTSLHEVGTAHKSIDAPASTVVASHWYIAQYAGNDPATRYVHQIATRANEPTGSAVHAVDSRLRELRKVGGTLPQRNYVYLFVKGWNYYANDQPIRSIAAKPKTGTPFRIPQPTVWKR